MEKGTKEADAKTQELRAERVRLIKARIEGNVNINIDKGEPDISRFCAQQELTPSVALAAHTTKKSEADDVQAHAMEADKVSTAGDIEIPEVKLLILCCSVAVLWVYDTLKDMFLFTGDWRRRGGEEYRGHAPPPE